MDPRIYANFAKIVLVSKMLHIAALPSPNPGPSLSQIREKEGRIPANFGRFPLLPVLGEGAGD
jgi:hypothetical protein